MKKEVRIEESWKRVLAAEFDKPYFAELADFVRGAYASGRCYPPAKLIFNAFDRTPFDKVKVVILGQDPYHEPGQAQGLAFYVPPDVQTPPSLVNIAKELKSDIGGAGCAIPDLMSWAVQGVLLLNAILSVDLHAPASHRECGWEKFTDAAIRAVSAGAEKRVAFILWGNYARSKKKLIAERHFILEGAHPSPLSAYRGFFGSRPFSQVEAALGDWRWPEL